MSFFSFLSFSLLVHNQTPNEGLMDKSVLRTPDGVTRSLPFFSCLIWSLILKDASFILVNEHFLLSFEGQYSLRLSFSLRSGSVATRSGQPSTTFYLFIRTLEGERNEQGRNWALKVFDFILILVFFEVHEKMMSVIHYALKEGLDPILPAAFFHFL